jgi:hypothetical protein
LANQEIPEELLEFAEMAKKAKDYKDQSKFYIFFNIIKESRYRSWRRVDKNSDSYNSV